jgi:hypothetical protein
MNLYSIILPANAIFFATESWPIFFVSHSESAKQL